MRKTILLLVVAFPLMAWPQQAERDSVKRMSLGERLLKPLKWVGKNWSDYDPRYSVPSFYNWAAHLQNTTTQEWLTMESPEGMDVKMRSQMSNRLGAYLGYRWLFYGVTVDLNSLGKTQHRKNEFTLSVNSNLMNIDLIRRRTGGDFDIKKLMFHNEVTGEVDMLDMAHSYDLGDYIKNSLTGININIFTNHRRYSNPAAFSNGAVQLRSVGSPIVGFGYTHQKVESDVSSIFASCATELMMLSMWDDPRFIEMMDEMEHADENDDEAIHQAFYKLMDIGWDKMKEIPELKGVASTFFTNRIPTLTNIDDWHLQLGYAYNLVFSRRLLLGLSAIVSPGWKRVRANNYESLAYAMADDFSKLIQKHDGVTVSPDYFVYDYDDNHFDVNTFLRASLTFNYNRWRAGINASFSNYFYKNKGMKVRNGYGGLTAYVGYCFGRKKVYRYNGARRQDYIMAALTKSQIEEMKDIRPRGNVDRGPSYQSREGATKRYRSDDFTINILGCDLVRGPEGKFGWFELEDGFVTPGQDTEGRLSKGTVLEVDGDGTMTFQAGHSSSFRAGNWWKSQIAINQTPNAWYPEMLHYALRGKLTLYLRGRIFGTRKPVRMEVSDFCIGHGRETLNFFQTSVRSFVSKSPYSIEGRVDVNGREYRVFIEQKGRGKQTAMYVSRVYPSHSDWMKNLDGQRRLSSVSMPGTHDAGTASLVISPVLAAAQTQNFSVPDQLRDGIRAFDIRLKDDLKYGHWLNARDAFDSTMVAWDRFLDEHPTECIVAMIGSDGGGKWNSELVRNYRSVIEKYPHRFVEDFDATTSLDEVRGKILVIRRQEDCPFGKLLKFADNAVFDYDCFHVEDVYKEHKTWKKVKLVEQNIREAYENENPNKWYITFNSIAWSPRRHTPYSYAWGGRAIRKPMNKTLREFVELKDYVDFGIVFLDFYNDHGEQPQVVETIINSNFNHLDDE